MNSIKKLPDQMAFLISAVSSPFVIILVFPLIIIAQISATEIQSFKLGALWIIFSTFIPLLFILFGVRAGRYSDVHVEVREQRTVPFVIAIASSLILFIIYYFISAPRELLATTICLVINGVVFLLTNYFWKISIHSAAIAGTAMLLSILIDMRYLWLFLLVPIVIWARLRRKRHNMFQVISAVIFVCVATYIVLILFGFKS